MKASLPKAEEDEDVDVDDDDDSRVGDSIQDSGFDEDASSSTDPEEDEEPSSDAEDGTNLKWESDGVGFSGVDGSVNPDPLRTPV